MPLTPQQIAEMDSLTGLTNAPVVHPKVQNNIQSRLSELQSLKQVPTNRLAELQNLKPKSTTDNILEGGKGAYNTYSQGLKSAADALGNFNQGAIKGGGATIQVLTGIGGKVINAVYDPINKLTGANIPLADTSLTAEQRKHITPEGTAQNL